MRVTVIFNPTAKGDKARNFQRHLEAIGSRCALKPTWAPGAARELAAASVREGFDTIVAAGGDGTLNEVLNGISDVPDGFARARLGVLPLGTVNVFGKELDIPENVPAAWEVVRAGKERAIDLPWTEPLDAGPGKRRYFAQMAGAGLDARAVELVNWKLKKRIGRFAYIWACWQAWRQPPARIKVLADGRELSGELAVAGNGRFYGGRYALWPNARPDDGLLDVCVLERVAAWTVAGSFVAALTNRLHRLKGLSYLQTRRLELRADGPTPFHVEGEAAGHLPLVMSLDPGRLRIVVP